MSLDILVKLILDSGIAKTHRLRCGIKVFIVGLDVLLILNLQSLGKLLVDIDELPLIDTFLFVEVVHDEEVLGLMRRDVDTVDLIEVRLTVVDHISEVVSVTEDVLTWVHEYLHLVGNKHLQRDEEYILLLVKNHGDVSKLQPLVLVFLERHSIQLVLGSRLVVVGPYLLVPLKDLYHLLLPFEKVLVIRT